ncbi:MAG: metallophosphoesterase family protein [Burkholderiales bacterium]|nr:metallophosphoesterase family protein [Burkholderiales bacterium]
MRIRILSDLHLEFNFPREIPEADCDLVVLAGDISNREAGIEWAGRTFRQPVVYVPGNHEYYEGELQSVEQAMRHAAAQFGHVHYLNQDVAVFADRRVRVIGVTLWTDYGLFAHVESADAMRACASTLADHRWITVRPDDAATRPFEPADALRLHRRQSQWLAQRLREPFDGKTVVVTHHAPHVGSLHPRFAQDIVSAGFVSDLSALMGPACLWVHGHTHDSFDYPAGGTRIVCNPRGYVGRRSGIPENPRFDWTRVVEI